MSRYNMDKKLINLHSQYPSLNERSTNDFNKESIPMSLPFLIKALLVCDDIQVQEGFSKLLNSLKNFEFKIESKLTFVTNEFQLAMVVFTGDEEQTIKDIEKITKAGVNIILIGDDLPQKLIRKSLKLAIQDVIPLATVEQELLPAIQSVSNHLTSKIKLAPLISVINGKGGSGASFITNYLGQLISTHSEHEIALFDGDLQHGSLSDALNFKPSYYLNDALNDVTELDSIAIKGMMSNRDNLSLLPIKAYSQLNGLANIDQAKLNQLLGKLRLNFQLCISDLSRGLDSLSIPILESSDHILIVVQQNIVSLREAKALVEQLKLTLGIAKDKLHIVVNRFSEKFSTIGIDDVRKTLGVESIFLIGNDYQLASACTDLGKSLQELSDTKRLEKDLSIIINNIIPFETSLNKKTTGFWSRLTGKK